MIGNSDGQCQYSDQSSEGKATKENLGIRKIVALFDRWNVSVYV
jgi:hypothetical protein